MKISVSGKQLNIGTSFTKQIEGEIESTVMKFFDMAVAADVVLSKSRHLYRADIVVNEGTGKNATIKADAEHDEIHSAFENARKKIEKQLGRYKGKMKQRHKTPTREVLGDNSYQQPSLANEDAQNPIIIAQKASGLEKLSVSEAAHKLEDSDLSFYVFINASNEAINVVYKREDNNISWVNTAK